MKQLQSDPDGKKPYEPPKIVTISLRPEEAILGGCKISATAGTRSSTCNPVTCQAPGS